MGNHAKVALIFAQTDPELGHRGLACFLVDTDQPGFQPRRSTARWACTAPTPPRSSLDDVEVADDEHARRGRRRLQGRDERAGLGPLLASPPAASASARAASTQSVAYAKEREQFGRPIASVPARAGDDRRHEASRPTPRGCSSGAPGWLKDTGQPNTTETSIAKLYATEAAVECANTAIQVHGGVGLRRRPPGRALLPRRARDDALRGHLADPEADHRPRADRHQRARPAELSAQA